MRVNAFRIEEKRAFIFQGFAFRRVMSKKYSDKSISVNAMTHELRRESTVPLSADVSPPAPILNRVNAAPMLIFRNEKMGAHHRRLFGYWFGTRQNFRGQ
jgi:hypothetical protein